MAPAQATYKQGSLTYQDTEGRFSCAAPAFYTKSKEEQLHLGIQVQGRPQPDLSPLPPHLALLEEAFKQDLSSTSGDLLRALLELLYCELVIAAWMLLVQKEKEAAEELRKYQLMCSRKVGLCFSCSCKNNARP